MEDSLDRDETLLPPEERQNELLQTQNVNTLGDLVDAHADTRYDLEMTTTGLDTALLEDEDENLEDVVGYAGNFSNDGMSGHRVDDALETDWNEPEATMAGEYGPNDADLESDIIDNLADADEQSNPEDVEAVMSSGVGNVRTGISAPTGFQIEHISPEGQEPKLINEPGEPDFAVVDAANDEVTPASARGLMGAEDEDDTHSRDVTEGT